MTDHVRQQLLAAGALPDGGKGKYPPAAPDAAQPTIPGQFGHVYVASLGTRYVVTSPVEPSKEYLAEWAALNRRYGLRPASTQHFTQSLEDAHTSKAKR